jgi:hypothetical protein
MLDQSMLTKLHLGRAVGVNLPARVVIVRGTTSWANGKLASYSDLDLLQVGNPNLPDTPILLGADLVSCSDDWACWAAEL